MDDRSSDPGGAENRRLFDAFAEVTYGLFGNSFLVVAGGAVGALVLFLITITVAWTLGAGGMAAVAGLVAIPVGYIVIARLMRGLIGHSSPRR